MTAGFLVVMTGTAAMLVTSLWLARRDDRRAHDDVESLDAWKQRQCALRHPSHQSPVPVGVNPRSSAGTGVHFLLGRATNPDRPSPSGTAGGRTPGAPPAEIDTTDGTPPVAPQPARRRRRKQTTNDYRSNRVR